MNKFLNLTPRLRSWCERHGLNVDPTGDTWQDFFEKILDIIDELEKKQNNERT